MSVPSATEEKMRSYAKLYVHIKSTHFCNSMIYMIKYFHAFTFTAIH
ncbi:hypothetical protein CIT292_10625 [Citrobacter youngae ATCC 29220]|uniref:Uncharacterized protein n=1 Tax=Citrobacter youngae ATCC 29220 TaxID=500640 RepID=D4BK09_9ENTR|nr:hypothetical protein CIT292_10625 [Citrobacter youngae ATCC 29220]